jgi:hypothetical protein
LISTSLISASVREGITAPSPRLRVLLLSIHYKLCVTVYWKKPCLSNNWKYLLTSGFLDSPQFWENVKEHIKILLWWNGWTKRFYNALTCETYRYSPITYYWTGLLMLDHSYLVGNLTNSKVAETKVLEPLKFWHFCISNFRTC